MAYKVDKYGNVILDDKTSGGHSPPPEIPRNRLPQKRKLWLYALILTVIFPAVSYITIDIYFWTIGTLYSLVGINDYELIILLYQYASDMIIRLIVGVVIGIIYFLITRNKYINSANRTVWLYYFFALIIAGISGIIAVSFGSLIFLIMPLSWGLIAIIPSIIGIIVASFITKNKNLWAYSIILIGIFVPISYLTADIYFWAINTFYSITGIEDYEVIVMLYQYAADMRVRLIAGGVIWLIYFLITRSKYKYSDNGKIWIYYLLAIILSIGSGIIALLTAGIIFLIVMLVGGLIAIIPSIIGIVVVIFIICKCCGS